MVAFSCGIPQNQQVAFHPRSLRERGYMGRLLSNAARNGLLRWYVLVYALFVWIPLAFAETYKKGDEVEVEVNSKRVAGTVQATNARGDVLVEYVWAVRPQQATFKAAQ